jgi:hypothetical protein
MAEPKPYLEDDSCRYILAPESADQFAEAVRVRNYHAWRVRVRKYAPVRVNIPTSAQHDLGRVPRLLQYVSAILNYVCDKKKKKGRLDDMRWDGNGKNALRVYLTCVPGR